MVTHRDGRISVERSDNVHTAAVLLRRKGGCYSIAGLSYIGAANCISAGIPAGIPTKALKHITGKAVFCAPISKRVSCRYVFAVFIYPGGRYLPRGATLHSRDN